MTATPSRKTWRIGLAAALLVRPVLLVPMAPSGPLGGSDLMPIALGLMFAVHVVLAAGVLIRSRIAIAFVALTAVAGVPLAFVGAYAGLPMPWPLVLAAWNAGVAAASLVVWREPARAP